MLVYGRLCADNQMFDQPELYKKLTEGTGDFTFRDMYEQFQNILKLGPLGKVMSMIPGLSNVMGPGGEKDAVARIKRFMAVMDSFTADELDSTDKVFQQQPNRCVRIARGAGVHVKYVYEVISVYKPFKGIASKVSTAADCATTHTTSGGCQHNTSPQHRTSTRSLAGCCLPCLCLHARPRRSALCCVPSGVCVAQMKGLTGLMDPKKMNNPRAMQSAMQQMSGMLNPQMLQQMGGASGMQRMMQQMAGAMGGGGGGPGGMGGGLQQMMAAMGGGGGGGGMGGMAEMMAAMGGGGGGMPGMGMGMGQSRGKAAMGKAAAALAAKKKKSALDDAD